jgi:hypothetical protein
MGHGQARKSLKFCSNSTTSQAYLTQIISVIDTLQANSSYNSIFKIQSANFIEYLKNTVNQELLRSDCDAFVKGLKAAKKADKEAEHEQKRLTATIRKQLQQVANSVTNSKGFYDFDN